MVEGVPVKADSIVHSNASDQWLERLIGSKILYVTGGVVTWMKLDLRGRGLKAGGGSGASLERATRSWGTRDSGGA